MSTGKYMKPGLARGFTLVELMVAMTITLIVSLTTTSLAVNAFTTNTQSIHMIQLTQELRSAIQLISRDIRRSGYDNDALARYLATEAVASGVTLGPLDANGTTDCLQVRYEDSNGNAKNAVYRLRVASEVGRVSAHFGATSDCTTAITDAGWSDVSDPLLVNVSALEFVLSDQLTDIATNSVTGNVIRVGVEQIYIVIAANLRANSSIDRSFINEVQLRNVHISV